MAAVVLWLSGIAVFGAVSGFMLGIWRIRLRRRHPSGAATPYRGNARWHHLFGLAGGLTLTTFIVSGWLSMNPNRWFSSPSPPADLASAYAGEGAPVGLTAEALRGLAFPDAVEMRFARIGGIGGSPRSRLRRAAPSRLPKNPPWSSRPCVPFRRAARPQSSA